MRRLAIAMLAVVSIWYVAWSIHGWLYDPSPAVFVPTTTTRPTVPFVTCVDRQGYEYRTGPGEAKGACDGNTDSDRRAPG